MALALALVLSVVLASSCGKSKPKAVEKTWPVAGVVCEAPGKADIRAEGSDIWSPAPPGSVVLYGDTVRNQKGAGLVMALSAGGTLRAGELTDIRIARDSDGTVGLELARGDAWIEGRQGETFRVSTPAARVTVPRPGGRKEACSFSVNARAAGATTVTMVKGTGRIEAAGEIASLSAGMRSVCEQGKAPGQPAKADVSMPQGGFSYFIGLQLVPYYRNAGTRDRTEDEARSRLAVEPDDAWSYVNLGRALSDAGNTTDAGNSFRKALELKPGFSQASAGLGMLALKDGRWSEASDQFEQARLADKSSLDALLGCSNSSIGTGDLTEATKWYKDTLETDPESHLALTGLAIVDLLQSRLTVAADNVKQALEIQPGHVPALLVQSFVFSMKGKIQTSLDQLKHAAESAPDDSRVRAAMADRYARTGMAEQALAAYKRLAGSDDKDWAAVGLQGMGCVAQSRGDLTGAIEDWTKAQEIAPEDPSVLEDLGQAQLLAGNPAAAVTTLSRAVNGDLTDWWGRGLLARAYLATGDKAQALDHAKVAAGLAPAEWSAHLVYGLALQSNGAMDEGTRELEKAVTLRPGGKMPAGYHAMLAEGLRRQGKKTEALAEYREAEKAAPAEGTYHRLAGELLTELNRPGEALAEYRKAVDLSPDDMLSRVRLAQAQHAGGKKDDAIDTLQRAIGKDPNHVEARIVLARYLIDDNDPDGAMFQLDAAIRMAGVSQEQLAEALVLSGNVKDRKEDFNGAVADYTKATAADPLRGDAWFYMAGDLERLARPADAKAAYGNAARLCRARPEWKKFYEESMAKLSVL